MLDPAERTAARPLRVGAGGRVRVAEGGGGGAAAVRAEGRQVAGGRAQQVGPRDLVDVVQRVAELGHGLHVAGSAAPHVVYLRMSSLDR